MSNTVRTLPANLSPYKVLGPWRGEAIHEALFQRHNTDAGVWGTLDILAGAVTYVLCDSKETFALSKGDRHVILPQEWHYLQLPEDCNRADLEIKVTFHRALQSESP